MSEQRCAVITGVTGQDGSFLAELLLDRGYRVVGLTRRTQDELLGLAEHLRGRLDLVHVDPLSPASVEAVLRDYLPDEFYHLGAPTFVPDSWRRPANALSGIAGSTASILEALVAASPATRVFVASSSEIFGDVEESPQREVTACRPRNPYGTAKLAAHLLVGQFRGHDDLFACSGILYNHESERRPENFVTRKVTRAAAAIKLGLATELTLGSLDSVRDWSFAGDIMRGAWLMLQQREPQDYILSSGLGHTVRELVGVAFASVGLRVEDHLRIDTSLERPPETTPPVGDSTRAQSELGWSLTHTFEELIQRMVQADLNDLSRAHR